MKKSRPKPRGPKPDPASSRDKVWFAGIAILIGVALLAGYLLIDALVPVFVAFALAYAAGPLADGMVRKGFNRTLAVALLMLGLALFIGVGLAFLLPALIREGSELAASLPDVITAAADRAAGIADRFGFTLPEGRELLDRLKYQFQSMSVEDAGPGMAMLKRLFTGLGNAAAWSVSVLIVPVFFFFFLKDLPAIKHSLLGLVPRRLQGEAKAVAAEIDRVFAGYIRGQLTVALLLGIIFATALTILQVRFGLVIGLVAGFLNIIPYIGQITGLVVSMLMVWAEGNGMGRLLALPALFGIVNFLESNFITPNIVGSKVGLSPPQAILALLLGAEVAGLVGMIIAVPLAGSFKVLLLDLVENYKKSHLYGGEAS